jgi:hypothetical protein
MPQKILAMQHKKTRRRIPWNKTGNGKRKEKGSMIEQYRPEGGYFDTAANREALASLSGLERAMQEGRVVEGIATLCDENMCLHVDLGCAKGRIDAAEAVYCRAGEERKDIAVISRVGKPVACRILGIEIKNGTPYVRLSRRLAQKECLDAYVKGLAAGDILTARVTHMEPFGAFLDVGCGVASLLSVDCISVSRISHPRDRLRVGESLPVAVKCIQRESERIYVTLRELLVPIYEKGVLVYQLPELEEIRAHCEREIASMWSSVLRFENPHNYYVDLSEKLWQIKHDMITAQRGERKHR